jgi:hypothetical protein
MEHANMLVQQISQPVWPALADIPTIYSPSAVHRIHHKQALTRFNILLVDRGTSTIPSKGSVINQFQIHRNLYQLRSPTNLNLALAMNPSQTTQISLPSLSQRPASLTLPLVRVISDFT